MLAVRVDISYKQEYKMTVINGSGRYAYVDIVVCTLAEKCYNVSLDSKITYCMLLFYQV